MTAIPRSTSPTSTATTCSASLTTRPTIRLPAGRPTARRSCSPAAGTATSTSTPSAWTAATWCGSPTKRSTRSSPRFRPTDSASRSTPGPRSRTATSCSSTPTEPSGRCWLTPVTTGQPPGLRTATRLLSCAAGAASGSWRPTVRTFGRCRPMACPIAGLRGVRTVASPSSSTTISGPWPRTAQTAASSPRRPSRSSCLHGLRTASRSYIRGIRGAPQQPNARAMTTCWISLVPSPISSTFASQ